MAIGCGSPTGGDDAGMGDMTLLPLHCTNGMTDADETDVDCGGSCGPCGSGEACNSSGQCACAPNCWRARCCRRSA